MKIKFNLPGDRIHHITHAYCRLIIPILSFQWIAKTEKGFKIVNVKDFHNTRVDGK